MSLNSATSSTPRCSICLESIITGSGRSMATLSCSHLFHLDCIGSEFNCKGVMQCPNCRLVEQGNWRFAAGNFLQDIMNDDQEDQENNPYFLDRVHDPLPLRSFMPNEFPHPPSQNIRTYFPVRTHPAVSSFPGISQIRAQNVWAEQTHINILSNSVSITIGAPHGQEIGITLGTSSHPNFPHPLQAHQPSRPQGTGSPAPNVPVRAQMPQPVFVNPVGSRQPPRQPSPPDEGDENNVPMYRFL